VYGSGHRSRGGKPLTPRRYGWYATLSLDASAGVHKGEASTIDDRRTSSLIA
jgi:hypothetical protein